MTIRKIYLAAACALAVLAAPTAQAELTLWVSYYDAASASYQQGRFAEAETLAGQARAETTTGHRTAFGLDVLGRVYTAQGRYAEAEECLSEALCLKRKTLGARSRTVPATLNALGDLHYIAACPEKAEAFYRQALDIHLTDPLNIEAVRSLNGLALLHHDRGEDIEAEKLLERAMGLQARAQRTSHPYLATVKVNLAVLYTAQSRYAEAGALLHDAAYVQGKVLRDDHPDVAVRLQAQAMLLHQTGHDDEAYELQQRAKAIRPDSMPGA